MHAPLRWFEPTKQARGRKDARAEKFRHDRHICLKRCRNRQRCSSDHGCYAEPEILVKSCPCPNMGNFIVSLEPYKNTILYQNISLEILSEDEKGAIIPGPERCANGSAVY